MTKPKLRDTKIKIKGKTGKYFLRKNPDPNLAKINEHIQSLKGAFASITFQLEEYKKIFDLSPQPILMTDENINIIYVNLAWEKLTGYKLSEVEGKNPELLSSGFTPPKIYKKLISNLKKGKHFITDEVVDSKKDGTLYRIYSTFYPVIHSDGSAVYIQVQHDITHQKELEDQLKFQSKIIENMAEGVLLVNVKDAKIAFVNPKFEKLFGYRKGELDQKPVYILNYGTNRKQQENVVRDIINTLKKTPEVTTEFLNVKKDGTPFWTEAVISEFNHSVYGNVWVCVQRDITEQKLLNNFKKSFISTASHELKTPITTLSLALHIMKSKIKKHKLDTIEQDIIVLENEIHRLTDTINELLNISVFESGKYSIRLKECRVSDFISKTEKDLKLIHNKIVMRNTVPSSVTVLLDQTKLESVFINLVNNSLKYADPKKPIEIKTMLLDNQVQFSVTDQGKGIPRSKLKHIFKEFYQTNADSKKGLGLGLYISKAVIDMHKGKMWVESTENVGSTFYFTIPIKSK